MAKHAVSFRELLVLRRKARDAMKAFKPAVDVYDESLPLEIRRAYVQTCNYVVELNAIMKDRYKESHERQQVIGYGETF